MNRFRARAGSALVALAMLASLASGVAHAESGPPQLWFAGTRLIFERPDRVGDEIAVRTSDSGLLRFLARVGATISSQPTSRYVVVTTADRRTLTYTLGEPRLLGTPGAPNAAYLDGNDVFIPFLSLARALYVEPIKAGGEIVLQPQLAALELRPDGRKTIVTIHAATPIRFTKVAETADRLTLAFSGVGSTLQQARRIETPGLSGIDVLASGSPRAPLTTMTFEKAANSSQALYPVANPNEIVIAFAPAGVALGGGPIPGELKLAANANPLPTQGPGPQAVGPTTANATTAPSVVMLPSAAPASPEAVAPAPGSLAFVTGVDVTPADDGVAVHIAISAAATYEWHRLGDDRFYIDVRGAALSSAARDERINQSTVSSMRVRQIATAPTAVVRVALTLIGDRRVEVRGDDSGITLVVPAGGSSDVARTGNGRTGGALAAVDPGATPLPQSTEWKFGAQPNPFATPIAPPPGSNPRLIVIDPGHGGTDSGAQHNGVVEKEVTLDISQRLKAVLVSRGWTVRMTRERDVDVFGPNAADIPELQARSDVANNSGARMFVSIHVNSSTSTSPTGTTSYYSKPQDRALAAAVQHRLIPMLHTKDDGVQRSIFYVLRHSTMPATLIETAFLSNPDDAALLKASMFRQSVAIGIADGIRDYAGAPTGAAASLLQQ